MAEQCQVCGASVNRGQVVTFSTLVEADPSAVNGSPETVVAAAVSSAADLIAPWLDALLDAASTNTGSSLIIEGRLWTAAQQLDLAPLIEHVFEQIMRGSMLGGLDAHWEGEHGEIIKPAKFAGSAIGPAGGIKDFTTKPFRQAIADFQSRNVVTRPVFDALNAEAKLKAFTVAGLLRDDILNTAHSELLNAVTAGSDLREFRKSLNARFESAGYTSLAPSHIETVFRTNVMTAYGAGRTEQMRQPHVIAARPYWQITGPNDGVAPAGRSRPAHFAARGKVLRVDDPFWQNSGAPPWGYNCRCRVISRSQADLDRLGLSLSTGSELADLPDKGFESRRLPPPPAPSAAPPAPLPAPKHDPRVPVQSVGSALRPFRVAPEKAHILKTTVGTGANQDMVAKLYSDAPTTVVKALEKAPLKDFEVSDDRSASNGFFWPASGKIWVRATREASGPGFAELSTAKRPWSMSSLASTPDDARKATFVHELGHHVQEAVGAKADKLTIAAFKKAKKADSFVTKYAAKNDREYFAESWAAFNLSPEALLAKDPEGHAMVLKTIKLLGVVLP